MIKNVVITALLLYVVLSEFSPEAQATPQSCASQFSEWIAGSVEQINGGYDPIIQKVIPPVKPKEM